MKTSELPMSEATRLVWHLYYFNDDGTDDEIIPAFREVAEPFLAQHGDDYLTHIGIFAECMKRGWLESQIESVEEGESRASDTVVIGMYLDAADWEQLARLLLAELTMKRDHPTIYREMIFRRRIKRQVREFAKREFAKKDREASL